MTVRIRQSRLLDQAVPASLRPFFRAYLLGYASSTLPRLLTLLLASISKKQRINVGEKGQSWSSLLGILRGGLEWQRFPTFCATLVGGSTLLQIPLHRLFTRLALVEKIRFSRWLSTFIAASLSIRLLQSKESPDVVDEVPSNTDFPSGQPLKSTKFAGRTIDLTLFAVTRALDVVVGELWARRTARRKAAKRWNKFEAAVSALADPSIFAASSALIMWSWVYLPERLPRAYNKWISGAAAVDSRLVTALNRVRSRNIVYGQDTGEAALLQSMCADYSWPMWWGDPAKSVPFPCEIVHMGTGPNCEYHAFRRFCKGFFMAAGMYGPLNLALQLRNPSKKGAKIALTSSLRSSAFLGTFIALFYYGVCLARTRLGPRILGKDLKSRQLIDSGVCIGCGCILCGWSILLENAGRRKDIALFVAPRALATLLPRRYEISKQWRENVVFAMSTAIVFTCVQENPARVRGVLGKILQRVLVQ